MPESRPRLRIVYPPGARRGDTFRRMAERMEAETARVRSERRALHEEYSRRSGPRHSDERPDVPAGGMCQADRLVAFMKAVYGTPADPSAATQRGKGGASA